MKQLTDLFFLLMNTGQYNMTRRLLGQLNNSFPQVSIDHFNALFFQVFIQVTLFGKHRFAFHHPVYAVLLQYGIHNSIMFIGIGSPMYNYSICLEILLKLHQVF